MVCSFQSVSDRVTYCVGQILKYFHISTFLPREIVEKLSFLKTYGVL